MSVYTQGTEILDLNDKQQELLYFKIEKSINKSLILK